MDNVLLEKVLELTERVTLMERDLAVLKKSRSVKARSHLPNERAQEIAASEKKALDNLPSPRKMETHSEKKKRLEAKYDQQT